MGRVRIKNGRRIRALVVDDSVVIRKIVTDALSADPMIEVVGTASNGRIALSKIPQVNPDLVTLASESPVSDTLLVMVAPRVNTKLPTTARDISNHANRLTYPTVCVSPAWSRARSAPSLSLLTSVNAPT